MPGPPRCPPPVRPLTSWGQRSLPICLSTLRSLSRSSCSLPSEAPEAQGWGQAQPQCPRGHRAPAPARVHGQAWGH